MEGSKTMGNLIVIEGGDGSGKSTVLEGLKKLDRLDIHFTREPGGTPYGEDIRDLIFDPKGGDAGELTQMNLFFASRALLFRDVVRPRLRSGEYVISDRLDSSSYAYQVHMASNKEELLKLFMLQREIIFREVHPYYVYLDVDPEIGLARVADREDKNHFDEQDLLFHQKVQQGYLEFMATVPSEDRVCIVNANQTADKVYRDVYDFVGPLLFE